MCVFTHKTRVSSFLPQNLFSGKVLKPHHGLARTEYPPPLDTPAWNSLPKYRLVMDFWGWLMSWDKLPLLRFPWLFRKGACLPNPRWYRHPKCLLLGTQHRLLLRKIWRIVSKWFDQPVRTEYVSLWLRRGVIPQSREYVLVAYDRMGHCTVNLGTNG